MTSRLLSLAGAALLALQAAPGPGHSPLCDWKAPEGPVVEVRNIDQLERAVTRARPGETILLADGRYRLRRMLDIRQPDVTIRSRSGDPSKVVLYGGGMTNDPVGVAISVSAPGVTVADVTIRDVGYHAVQVRGEQGAERFTLHNARLIDAGQQLLKGSAATNGRFADSGTVACSDFSYTNSAPGNYTNGMSLIAVKGWHVRDNRFTRIRGPEAGNWNGGPAVLVWGASEDTIVERNVIIDSFRGIALGLAIGATSAPRNGEKSFDHRGGIIRNNVIVNLHPWADEAIEANAAQNVRIEHNTVLTEGAAVKWSIGVRFPSATAHIRNNLTSYPVLLRNGAKSLEEGNVEGASRSWFIDAPNADLRLAPGGVIAVDAGVPIPDVNGDFAGQPRVAGAAPDAGAFEQAKGTVR